MIKKIFKGIPSHEQSSDQKLPIDTFELLNNWSESKQSRLLQYSHLRSYKEGEYVFYENDPGTGLYFIENGSVELLIEKSDERIELGPGRAFGLLSLCYDMRRISSAKCLTKCRLRGIFKPDFESIQSRYPDLAFDLLQLSNASAVRHFLNLFEYLGDKDQKMEALKRIYCH